jgi:hypothetical protein
MKAAKEWFDHLGRGGANKEVTVKEVCLQYVADLRDKGKVKTAVDVEKRFNAYVFNHKRLSDTDIQNLKQDDVRKWRKSFQATPAKTGPNKGAPRVASSFNRDITPFRAALNAAFHKGLVTSAFAWEQPLLPIPDADGRRDVYLDTVQRRALADNAPPDLATLVRAMSLVPVRPGALARMTVADLNRQLGTLRLQDKTGKRTIALPAEQVAFFAALTENKLPTAHLLTRSGGKPWNKDAWKDPIKAAAKAASLPPDTTLYAIRHGVISDLVHAGLDLLTVGQVSGTSQRMIEKHYGHLVAEQSKKALSTLRL